MKVARKVSVVRTGAVRGPRNLRLSRLGGAGLLGAKEVGGSRRRVGYWRRRSADPGRGEGDTGACSRRTGCNGALCVRCGWCCVVKHAFGKVKGCVVVKCKGEVV